MTMKNPQTCLSAELLRQLSHDELGSVELKDVEDHVSSCERCRQLLEIPPSDAQWQHEIVPILRTPVELPWLAGDHDDRDREGESLESILRLLGPTDDPQMLGRIGSYEIVGVIGRGGMGVVFKAHEAALNRFVAIKLLLPHLAVSGAARKRFVREGQAAAAVIDDNVMPIFSVAEWQGVPYLVMQYSRGGTLQKRIQDHGPLELKEILRIGMQTARGLAAAHAQGLVHRDVKPSNILLDATVERALLTDFGLARAVDDASITRTGIIAGTPQYMSPEQARGTSIDSRSDLFGLGCVLYAMCTGRPPFRADSSYAILRMITDDEPKAIREISPDIPEWLCQLISRLMAKSPDARYQNALEVAALLEQCLAHVQQPASARLPMFRLLHAAGRRSIFNAIRKGAIAMLSTIGICLLGFVLWQATDAPDIAGKWSGEEWGVVELTSNAPGEYQGKYYRSHNNKPGDVQLHWSRLERRFNGSWNEGADCHGDVSLRLVGSEIRGSFRLDDSSRTGLDVKPKLGDLLCKRVPSSAGPLEAPADAQHATSASTPGEILVAIYGGRGIWKSEDKVGKLVASLNALNGVRVDIREDGGGDTFTKAVILESPPIGERDKELATQVAQYRIVKTAIDETLRTHKIPDIRWLDGSSKQQAGLAANGPDHELRTFADDNAEQVYSQIVSDWSKREAATSSLEAVFAVTRVDEVEKSWRDPNEKIQIPSPPHEERLLLSGEKWRQDRNILRMEGVGSEWKSVPMTEAFNAVEYRQLFESGVSGFMGMKGSRPSFLQLEYLAIGGLYRGTLVADFKTQKWNIENERLIWDGVSCVAMIRRYIATEWSSIWWVDLARASLPMRYEDRIDGQLTLQVNLHYDQGGQLSSWDFHSPGRVSGVATIASLKTNIEIDDGKFSIAFPKGCIVTDRSKGVELESLGDEQYRPWVRELQRPTERQ